MIPDQPRVLPVQVSIPDHADTVIEEWRREEALTSREAIPQSQLASARAARRGPMTPDSFDDGGLPRDLAIDAALCDRLVSQRCSGPEWEVFVSGLYRKATRVAYRWMAEGKIFAESAKQGRTVASGDIAEWERDDLRALAHEVVQEAFTLFRTQLLDRRYDASRGATLFTYFMNAVVRQFPNVFRRTRRSRASWENRVDFYGDPREHDCPDRDDYYSAHARYAALLFSLIRGINAPQQREAAWLSFVEGHSNEQIAQRLSVSPDAARALVNRARTAMQNIYLQHEAEKGGRR